MEEEAEAGEKVRRWPVNLGGRAILAGVVEMGLGCEFGSLVTDETSLNAKFDDGRELLQSAGWAAVLYLTVCWRLRQSTACVR